MLFLQLGTERAEDVNVSGRHMDTPHRVGGPLFG